MSEELVKIKNDLGALERCYSEYGGKLAADRDHCACPLCGSSDGFWIGISKHTGKPGWKCFAKCPPRSRQVSIVDFVMCAAKVESKEACKIVLAKYGAGVVPSAECRVPKIVPSAECRVPSEGIPPPAAVKKSSKLHLNPDLACDAVLWSIQQKKDPAAQFARRWNYTDAAGMPVFTIARFNLTNGHKEIIPIRRDGNGWRVGLGEWGSTGKLMPMYGLNRIMKEVNREKESQK